MTVIHTGLEMKALAWGAAGCYSPGFHPSQREKKNKKKTVCCSLGAGFHVAQADFRLTV